MSKYNSKCPLNCNKKGCGIHICQRYADYQQGKADVAREFAKLLKKKFNEYIDYDDNGEQTFESNPDLVWSAIDEVLAEWQNGDI